jgi:hypothetical protein
MSTLRDLFDGVTAVLAIRADVRRLSEAVQSVQAELRSQDSRIVRLEAFVEIGQRLLMPPR